MTRVEPRYAGLPFVGVLAVHCRFVVEEDGERVPIEADYDLELVSYQVK